MNIRSNSREALSYTYFFCRKVIKFCKNISSKQIVRVIIIYTIGKKPSTIIELADQFGVNHSWMSAAVSALENKGLVNKKLTKDTRYRIVSLTPKGKKVLGDILERMDDHGKNLFKFMSPDEIVNLTKIVKKANFSYSEPSYSEEMKKL